ncbi:MAG: hypothetical protein RSF67_09335 [Clostridia bacterium]
MKKTKDKDMYRIILFFIGVLLFEVYLCYSVPNIFSMIGEIESMNILNSEILKRKLFIDNILISLIWILPWYFVFNMIKNSIIQVDKFLKTLLIAIIVSYILTISFVIFSIIFAYKSIYFKGYIFSAIVLISFINVISWHIILMTICIKLIGGKLKDLNSLIKASNILLLCILSVSLFQSSTVGFFIVLISIPTEIKVSYNNISYNIRKDGFLVQDEKEYNFIYNK